MLIWNAVRLLFTDFGGSGDFHTLFLTICILAISLLQVFAFIKNKPLLKWLPVIISTSLAVISEIAIWVIAALSGSLVAIVFLFVALLYSVAAAIPSIIGALIFTLVSFIRRPKIVYVRDFIALPCDDCTDGIAKAILAAKKKKAYVIQFESGIYALKSYIEYETDQTAHDAGAEHKKTKDVHILAKDLKNLIFSGAVDKDGNPTTVLEGFNNLQKHTLLPSILWVDGGDNITVQNFKFRRNPEFASAGQVVNIKEDIITLNVFENNPCYDNMPTFCMNRFSADGDLKGESLSYGDGLAENFRLVGDRILTLKDERVASRVEIGDIITFHQGAKTDFQCFFGNVANLKLKNLHTTNSNGFAHLAFNVHNLSIENVKFKPEGNQYFTAPRDAFKLHKCCGNIEVDGLYVDGVRMDGQNMHSNYIFPLELVSENTIRFFTRYAFASLCVGTDIEFYFKNNMSFLNIQDWTCEGAAMYDGCYGYIYLVTFTETLKEGPLDNCLCLARCWEPTSYVCKNSTFINIAGAGHLSRIDHLNITNCKYKNLMNSGILLGAEFPIHTEGGHSTDVSIERCFFENCGATSRYDAMGCIGIKSSGIEGKNNKDIKISECCFKNSPIGIDVHDADGVYINDCHFENIHEKVRIDSNTCANVFLDKLEI